MSDVVARLYAALEGRHRVDRPTNLFHMNQNILPSP